MIDPNAIPIPKADPDGVEEAGRALQKDGTTIAQTGDDIHSAWQGLDAFYTAPHEQQLFAATKPIATAGHGFKGEVTTVGNALVTFAGEIRPLISRLQGLKSHAQQFRAGIEGDDDWREDEDKVKEHNQLNDDILAAIAAYQEAERACANKITGVFGGTHFIPGDGDPKAGEKGYGLGQAPKGIETPWAKPQEYDAPWWEDAWNGVKDFGVGIVTDLADLVGIHGENGWVWEEDSHFWSNLGNNWMGVLEDTAGLVGLHGENGWVWEEDSHFWSNLGNNWKEVAHSFVPWREWGDRPGYVITSSILNIGSCFVGVGLVRAGVKLLKRGDADTDGGGNDRQSGDRDGDGRIDQDEVGFQQNPSTQDLQNQVNNLDIDTGDLQDSLDDMEDLQNTPDRDPAHVGGNEQNGQNQQNGQDDPTSNGRDPANNDRTPQDTTPDGGNDPSNADPTPDGGDPTPDGGDPTPDGGDPTPDGGDPTPDGADPTPDGGDPTPDGGDPTPDGGDPTPDGGDPTPDGADPTPDGGDPTPDGGDPTPDGADPTPDGGDPTPDGDGRPDGDGDGKEIPPDHFGDQDPTQPGPVGDKFRPGVYDPPEANDIDRFDDKERETAEQRADEGRLVTRLPRHPDSGDGFKSMDALERSGPDDPGTPTEYKDVGKNTRRAFDHQLKNGLDKFNEQPDGTRLSGDIVIDGRRAGLSEDHVVNGLKSRLGRMLGADDARLNQLGRIETYLGDGSKIVFENGKITKIDADGEHDLGRWDPDSRRFVTPDENGPRGDGKDGDGDGKDGDGDGKDGDGDGGDGKDGDGDGGDGKDGDDDGGTPKGGAEPPSDPRGGGGAKAPDGDGPDVTPVRDGADGGPGDPGGPGGGKNPDGGQQGPQQNGPGTPDPTPGGADPTPDGGDPTPNGGDPTPDGGDPTPDGGDPTPDGGDPTPDGSDPLPGHMDDDGIRRFDTDDDGQDYGDRHLSDQYNDLPAEERAAIREYTRHSWPYNPHLRGQADVANSLRQWYANVGPGWSLFEMNHGRPPSMSDIYDAAHRTDLTPEQRHIVDDILNNPQPGRRLEAWIQHSGARGIIARSFDGFPTVAEFNERVRLIDQALSHRLPEGVQVLRGLHDVNFMNGFNGNPRSLIGTVQTEQSFMSTALGRTTPPIDGQHHPIVMHMDVPEGSRGLWMGRNSLFPDQRELILPRNTRYEIMDARVEADGKLHLYAKVLETPVNDGL
ncbi:ADP-ribosyltransferase [Actinomadura pelletieri]|uniref:ADP-ribosyltransferase n=1 Tax=Actinomadura pelletieri TaxID=111805 RepID=UPI000EAD5529|nr:ADP-ribosyltransferase [Actinomadura pelletieri]